MAHWSEGLLPETTVPASPERGHGAVIRELRPCHYWVLLHDSKGVTLANATIWWSPNYPNPGRMPVYVLSMDLAPEWSDAFWSDFLKWACDALQQVIPCAPGKEPDVQGFIDEAFAAQEMFGCTPVFLRERRVE